MIGIGVRTGAGVGAEVVWRTTGEPREGCLAGAGAEAARGARVRVDATTKVMAEVDAISAPKMVLHLPE